MIGRKREDDSNEVYCKADRIDENNTEQGLARKELCYIYIERRMRREY